MFISWFMLILSLLLVAVVGYFIGNTLKGKNDKNWQGQYKELEKKYSEAHNENKKSKKQLNNINKKVDSWKQKFESSEEKYIPLTKKLETEKEELQALLNTKTTEYDKVEFTNKQLANRKERLEIDLKKAQEKYATDLSDSKGWKNLRDRLNRQLEEHKAKLVKLEKDKAKLETKLETQNKEVNEARKITGAYRVLKATNKKLEKDLKYWEQKHYDTHHELAKKLEEIEGLEAEKKNIDLLHKGALIKEQTLLEKIQEFKTKFVVVNNKYHELIKK